MKSWMRALADHYMQTREKYPRDHLVILFDIDGTILDTRYTVLKLLKSYDREHGCTYFENLHLTDITFNEEDLAAELRLLDLPEEQVAHVCQWYETHRWTSWAVFEGNKPYPGVLEVMRWFQLQPNTDVGLNSNRSEVIRRQTLETLNRLGKEFRIHIRDELLLMNPDRRHISSGQSKIDGIRTVTARGYRVFAMVDNEPGNLDMIAGMENSNDILLLHANRFFNFDRKRISDKLVNGKVYDLTELIHRRSIPKHIQFVWQGVNNGAGMKRFLDSNVHWADFTELVQPLITHNRETGTTHGESGKFANLERLFGEYLKLMKHRDRGIRLCLDYKFHDIEFILDRIVEAGLDSKRLWFSAGIDHLNEDGFRFLADAFPGAVIECPVDFLGQVIMTTPQTAEHLLDMYSGWGVNRFALSWRTSNIKRVSDVIETWGFDLTIYDIRNLETFLQAVLLTPRAIVSNFNFPSWKTINQPADDTGVGLQSVN